MTASTVKQRFTVTVLTRLILLVTVFHLNGVLAADFKCKGERIEKTGSIWGYARQSGADFRIEKGSSTIGWVKNAGDYWRVETPAGATLAWLKEARIETPGGSTWVTLNAIEDLAECPIPVTAGLWVLIQVTRKNR